MMLFCHQYGGCSTLLFVSEICKDFGVWVYVTRIYHPQLVSLLKPFTVLLDNIIEVTHEAEIETFALTAFLFSDNLNTRRSYCFRALDTDADKQQNRKPPVVFFTKHLGWLGYEELAGRWRRWDTMVRI